MRGLREERSGHRGLRPGILILALLAALAGCSGRAPGAADGSAGAGASAWLQLQSGTFQPVADPGAAGPVAHRPWTVQSRVADMAFLDGTLYLGVNGSGLASIGRDPTGTLAIEYHSDSLIFGHRTITALIPRQGSLAIHLYFNALLNDVRQQDLSLAGISLVSYSPRLADYAFLIPPFQRLNPDWEAVGFAAESENSFDFEWKYTDASETRFQYTRYHADTKVEEPADRDTFLAALGVPAIEGASVPSALASFFAVCRAEIPSLAPGTSLQFSLRSRENPVRRNYRSRKESETAVAVPMFEEDGRLLALLPDGRILGAESGGAPKAFTLPRLPQDFRYTDFVKWGNSLVIPWEEVSFTDVGRAGILVYPFS
ncbi:MAG: hypothetical protein ACLQDL_14030 [Spirochaetia bacterium]